jgi:hypothetical protein
MACKVQPESIVCPLCLRGRADSGGVQWRACGLNGEALPNTFPTCRRCWITNMRRVGHDDSGEYLAPVLASVRKRAAKRSDKYQARVRETHYGQVLATSHRTQAPALAPGSPALAPGSPALAPGSPALAPGSPALAHGKAGEASGTGGLTWETYLSLDPLGMTWESVYARFGYRLPSSPYRAEPLPVYRPKRGRAGATSRTRPSTRSNAA